MTISHAPLLAPTRLWQKGRQKMAGECVNCLPLDSLPMGWIYVSHACRLENHHHEMRSSRRAGKVGLVG